MENIPPDMFADLFDFWSLAAGLIFGVVGIWLFRLGRKRGNNRNVIVGIALMVYPYFIRGALLNWGIGFALCGYAYYTWE